MGKYSLSDPNSLYQIALKKIEGLQAQVQRYMTLYQTYFGLAVLCVEHHMKLNIQGQGFWEKAFQFLAKDKNPSTQVFYSESSDDYRKLTINLLEKERQIEFLKKSEVKKLLFLKEKIKEKEKIIQHLDKIVNNKYDFSNWMDLDSIELNVAPEDLFSYLGKACSIASFCPDFLESGFCAIVNSEFLVAIKIQEREKFLRKLSFLTVMEPSQYPRTISSKKFIISVSTIVFALNQAEIKQVKIVCHGLKDICLSQHSFPKLRPGIKRFDFGATLECCQDLVYAKPGPEYQLYPVFGSDFGNYILKGKDYELKVYNTMIHHIKHRGDVQIIKKKGIEPWSFTQKISKAQKFVQNLSKNGFNPKTRFEVTIKKDFKTMAQAKSFAQYRLLHEIQYFLEFALKVRLPKEVYLNTVKFSLGKVKQKGSKKGLRQRVDYYDEMCQDLGITSSYLKRVIKNTNFISYDGLGEKFKNEVNNVYCCEMPSYNLANQISHVKFCKKICDDEDLPQHVMVAVRNIFQSKSKKKRQMQKTQVMKDQSPQLEKKSMQPEKENQQYALESKNRLKNMKMQIQRENQSIKAQMQISNGNQEKQEMKENENIQELPIQSLDQIMQNVSDQKESMASQVQMKHVLKMLALREKKKQKRSGRFKKKNTLENQQKCEMEEDLNQLKQLSLPQNKPRLHSPQNIPELSNQQDEEPKKIKTAPKKKMISKKKN